jgi:alkylated DNA repair dioxygenase AlkB
VSQLKLFDSCQGILADDERGRVTYTPDFVDAETAQAWFTELRSGVNWRSERREMYDREVEVPRLLGHFRLDPAPGTTPAAIREAARRVTACLRVPFNSVGLNLYRDGRDSVAAHNDHLYDIREGFPIALLSLGATRRMTIRAKAAPRRSIHVDLEPGSLLVMNYETQIHYTHGVPKTRAAVGERISLAFRMKAGRTDRGPPKRIRTPLLRCHYVLPQPVNLRLVVARALQPSVQGSALDLADRSCAGEVHVVASSSDHRGDARRFLHGPLLLSALLGVARLKRGVTMAQTDSSC